MIGRNPVTIVGPPLDAWLTATMLARFAPLAGTPLQVFETPPVVAETEIVIARPDMVRTHVSIGLNPKHIGGRPVQAWTGPDDQAIPFNSLGQPLKGASFISVWLRARDELGETRPLTRFASPNASGAFAFEAGRYSQALKAIATKVGVKPCTEVSGQVVQADPDFVPDGPARLIGAAAMPLRASATLRLQAVHQTVLALIDCWPWRESDQDLSVKEYERRLASMSASMTDMQSVLWSRAATEDLPPRLQHRLAVWQSVGRIAPMDDDLFEPQEWIAAFSYSGAMPSRTGRLAKSLTEREIAAHIEACAPKDVVHV